MNNTALVLIDLQRDFLEINGRMHVSSKNAVSVISSANTLIKHAKVSGWKVIFIKNEYKKSDWIGNLFRRYASIERSLGAEIDPRVLLSENDLIITKSKSDAFTNPEFEKILKNSGTNRIVVLGVMTEGCVRATVKSAIHKGFSVTLVSDGTASTKDFLKSFGVASAQKAGASIMKCYETVK